MLYEVITQPCTDVLRRNVFIPRGVWANVVVDAYSVSTGSPIYKGGTVYIEPSEDEVLEAEYIIDNRITSYNVCYTKLLRLYRPSQSNGKL